MAPRPLDLPGTPTSSPAVHPDARRGRGAITNVSGRFEPEVRVTKDADFDFDDGWGGAETAEPTRTTVEIDSSRTIIARNQSPDIGFDRSINPYRGCEHGCFYCFARPTHAYLGLSPGLDFETRLFAKPDAARERARQAELHLPDDRDGHQHRSLPADRGALCDYPGCAESPIRIPSSRRNRD